MKEAYRLTRKDGAPGIDDVTAADYATNLEANLLDLLAKNFASMLIEVDPNEGHLLADTARQLMSSILPGDKR
jgi:hypothetical protein